MRELTQEEIDNAPEWATHYKVFNDGDVMYESTEYYWWEDMCRNARNWGGIAVDSKLIPYKPFDISEYEFSDSTSEIEIVNANDTAICLTANSEKWFSLTEEDAMAFVKHFESMRAKNVKT